jgi:hypothetical protein
MSMMFVQPNPNVVTIVERVQDAPDPEYLVAARTRCVRCDLWCWLGDKSMEIVMAGQATPLCQNCAREVTPGGLVPFDYLTNALKEGGQG